MKVGFGGSCHWCTEAIFQSLLGVTKVDQGWIRSEEYPIFSEAVVVQFDDNIISLEVLIKIHLYTHSCTSSHSMREKYRSAIYVYSEGQREVSRRVIKNEQFNFKLPIITKILIFDSLKINEDKYLDYYYKNPEKAFCKNQIDPKLKKLIALFSNSVDGNKLKL